MKIDPIILEGEKVRLEPLRPSHLDGLCEIGMEAQVWEWTSLRFDSREKMAGLIEMAGKGEAAGRFLSFAIIARPENRIAGTTTLGPISLEDRNGESGLWLGREFWGRGINSEVKFLILRHAFETLGLIRVEFRADPQNERSRKAIVALGAKEEGTLRRQKITDRGRIRDTVIYSLLVEEWPATKARLLGKLGQR